MVVCVECSVPLSSTCRRFPPHFQNIRLTRCAACGKTADKYVEYEVLLIFIDLLLHKPQAYRHLIFNRLPYAETGVPPSVRNFAVVCILFDTYTRWFLLHASLAGVYFQHAKERTAAQDDASRGERPPPRGVGPTSGEKPWSLAAEELPDPAAAQRQVVFRRSSQEAGRPCLPAERDTARVSCQELSLGDPGREGHAGPAASFAVRSGKGEQAEGEALWRTSSLSVFTGALSPLDYETGDSVSVGRGRRRWRRSFASENVSGSVDAEPSSASPDLSRRTRRRKRRPFWCSPFYLGVGVATFVAFSLFSSGRDRSRLCSLAPLHLLRTSDALSARAQRPLPSEWHVLPPGALAPPAERRVGLHTEKSLLAGGGRRAPSVEAIAAPHVLFAAPPAASLCLGDDSRNMPLCPPALQWDSEAESTTPSLPRERSPGSDGPVSQADVHADVLRWLLQSSPLAAWDLQVFIIAQCTLDFFVYLFSAIVFTWLFVRWHYGSHVYRGWEDAARRAEGGRPGRRVSGGSRDWKASARKGARNGGARSCLCAVDAFARPLWVALLNTIEASAPWVHALCVGTGTADDGEQRLVGRWWTRAASSAAPGAFATASGRDSQTAGQEKDPQWHIDARSSARESQKLHAAREKKTKDAVSYVLRDGHAEREEAFGSAAPGRVRLLEEAAQASDGKTHASDGAAATADGRRALRVTFIARGRGVKAGRVAREVHDRAVIVKYNYLAAALIVSMFGKMATLLMMAWEENLHLQYFVSFFTLSSNVVAVSVFLNGAHPVASCLIVLGAVGAKALARLAQILLLPPLKFPAFGILTPSLYGGALTHQSSLALLSRDAQWAMSFVLDLVT
ncbi:Protein arv1, related [Neospora caninum Liverpool]|uniref:Protein ARV n=1 Tax=Neospora caninum (strain Liverpool) TaxID=572307 RepID=F0VHZ2_NEOCL|nr:Protein arv1, related [Neospora caninum Liverpool]CBZ53353.1 Protein arv1, related [Neospora caninum Liverpool]CEL67339.1 TPA: Protein arv1, related [Neospora caninum Liverpool]|eukprot:XP_003883385.1 Protein arv1, related [Neospora caninum Liverpool]